MARGFLVLGIFVLVSVCSMRARVLVELDSFLSARAQETMRFLVERADAAQEPVNKIYKAFSDASFPVKNIVRTQRADGVNVYRISCYAPACLLKTDLGSFVAPFLTGIYYPAALFDSNWLQKLIHCDVSARYIGAAVLWLQKQDPVQLAAVAISWRDKNAIWLQAKSAKELNPHFLITQARDLDAELKAQMDVLVGFCAQTKQGESPVFDLRYDGMIVHRNAQKNRKGGGR